MPMSYRAKWIVLSERAPKSKTSVKNTHHFVEGPLLEKTNSVSPKEYTGESIVCYSLIINMLAWFYSICPSNNKTNRTQCLKIAVAGMSKKEKETLQDNN